MKDMAMIRFVYKLNPYELPDQELSILMGELKWLIQSGKIQELSSPF